LNCAVSLQLSDSITADLQGAGRLVTAYGGEQNARLPEGLDGISRCTR
jgi:hypothetical protein